MRRPRPPVSGFAPNLAPLVDVVMVILIFFMLGTTFVLTEGAFSTQAGPTRDTGVPITPVVEISLRPAGGPGGCQIHVMNRPLETNSFDGLAAYMQDKLRAGADPRGRVVIAADDDVRYEAVIAAMDACVRAGFENLAFAVDAAPTVGGPSGPPS